MGKKLLPHGNCAYCDAERGVPSTWGMSPEGWAHMKDEHDAGHPAYKKHLASHQEEPLLDN